MQLPETSDRLVPQSQITRQESSPGRAKGKGHLWGFRVGTRFQEGLSLWAFADGIGQSL